MVAAGGLKENDNTRVLLEYGEKGLEILLEVGSSPLRSTWTSMRQKEKESLETSMTMETVENSILKSFFAKVSYSITLVCNTLHMGSSIDIILNCCRRERYV